MEEKSCLEIKFLSFRENPEVDSFIFDNIKYNVKSEDEKKIEIPSKFFDENESKKGSIKLISNSVLVNECILEIFKGYNYFYCFLDERGFTFHLLFNNNNPNITIPLYKDNKYSITKYDNNNTKYRKRYTFINANFFSIMIDNKYFSLPEFITDFNTHQLSFYDIKNKLVIQRPLLLDEESNFKETYMKYTWDANQFKTYIENNIKKINSEQIIVNSLESYTQFDNINIYLNKNKSKLENVFNNELFIEFYKDISLYSILKTLISKTTMKNIKSIINYYFDKVKNITDNNSLKVYQKILLIEYIVCLIEECKSMEELENTNFCYYLMDKKEKDSVLDLVDKFFKEYVLKITEESPVFEKLIELDGDPGIYKNESFYCFNMQNLYELKKHLQEIETNIFVIHDLNKKHFAFTNIKSGIVSINVHNIEQYKLFNHPLDKALTKENKELGEIIASKIVYYMIHETNGHKKFSYKKNKIVVSPRKFIEKGEVYTLCERNSNEKGDNCIKIVPEGSIGEDGYFLELIYGKIDDYFVFEILDNLNDFSDLLSEVDLWVNDFDSLKEYVKYKYAIQKYGVIFKSQKATIKEKINDYKNKCYELQKQNMIYIDTFFKKDKINQHKKKKYIEFDKKFNPIKEKNVLEGIEDEINSPKGDNKKIDDKNKENVNLIITEKNEEEKGEEEEESGEEEEEEEKIRNKDRDKILIKMPEETLRAFEKAGFMTKMQVNSYIERRKRSLLTSVRYCSEI